MPYPFSARFLGAVLERCRHHRRVPDLRDLPDQLPPPAAQSRVPEPTLIFWVTKATSTALGEAVSDYSIRIMAPELAVLLGFAFFVGAVGFQLTRRRYGPTAYWMAVAAVGVFGTMAADVMHVALGVPYILTATIGAAGLAVVFAAWRRSEGTVSVHAITTTRRELFYWAAVVGTFALGTAVGDLTAVGLGIGYVGSIALFTLAIAAIAAGFRWAHWPAVPAFWAAYVLTRPWGASVADALAKPAADGGAGIGSGWVALALALLMVVLVAMMGRRAATLAPAAA